LTVVAVLVGIGLFFGGLLITLPWAMSWLSGVGGENRIAVIPIEGLISAPDDVTAALEQYRKDEGVRAVILRVNSPGGTVGAAQEIAREVAKTALVKPVIASLGDVAASGGYYVAAGAGAIVANPGTITGSIGVLMEFLDVAELMDRIGIQLEVVKSVPYKDMGSPHRELTDAERQLLVRLAQDLQTQFEAAVAQGRGMALEDVQAIADGRVFSGARAQELGLVDRLGNFQDAVETAAAMAGLKGEPRLVYPERPGFGIWDVVTGSALKLWTRVLGQGGLRLAYQWRGTLGSR